MKMMPKEDIRLKQYMHMQTKTDWREGRFICIWWVICTQTQAQNPTSLL